MEEILMNRSLFLALFLMVLFGTHWQAATAGSLKTLPVSEFALNATSKVTTVWATAYQVTVTLTNNTSVPTTSWTATFTMPQGNTLSTYVSSGDFQVSGQNVTVSNLSGKGVIQPGQSTSFGMIIDMPLSGQTVINNLQAIAYDSNTPPPGVPIPVAPVLNAITLISPQSYTVSWNSVANATSYTLQQDISSSFPNPTVVAQGNVLSNTISNAPNGTYFYRVFATDASGNSPYSNVQSITISQVTPPPITGSIEHSAWYIDWTSWFTGPPFVLPSGNNVLNVFVGELMFDSSGNPTLGGFGNMTLPQLSAFTAYCAEQVPPIAVKVSIGGGGGMYDNCWDLLTAANISAFAQGMANFCHTYGLVGVDFDYEEFASAAQETLVGTLIKEFKAIDPSFQTSLCTNAGFGPNYPWQQAVENILNAAVIAPGNCAVDRVYIMSYYDSMQDEENWIVMDLLLRASVSASMILMLTPMIPSPLQLGLLARDLALRIGHSIQQILK
jgi:Cellulose binding domain/Glycosyl hydrolases family 18